MSSNLTPKRNDVDAHPHLHDHHYFIYPGTTEVTLNENEALVQQNAYQRSDREIQDGDEIFIDGLWILDPNMPLR